jgi:pimeloyl-ACP methyl ester carboxylesterase
MSNPGDPNVGRPTQAAYAALTAPAPDTREGVIEAAVARGAVFRGGGFPYDADRIRRRAAAAYDRAHDPAGKARQQSAVIASGDRTDALRRVRVPTVVIHGEADPLSTVGGGKATAAAIPGSTLVTIPGMGHEFPVEVRPQIVAAVVANIGRAG